MQKKTIAFIIIGVVSILLFTAVLVLFFTASTPASGKIYDEETQKPISGISVTDGRNVVKTSEDGSFTLKGFRKSHFIVMTVPSGYTAKTYYIPTSKETKSYNFYLIKEKIPTTDHTFLQISDSEVGEKGCGEWLNETKRLVNEIKPKFLIHTGDICYEAGLKQHIKDMNTENMGCDVKYIIGNHDYVKGDYGEKLFEENYGPIWYSFEIGNVHYVVTPIQNGDAKSGYNKNDRWRWLYNDLENTDSNKKVVIFNHTNSPTDDYVIKFDRKELDLKKYNLEAWIFGHYHYNFVNEKNGVLNISTARPDCGGIDQSASSTREINVNKDGKITTKLHYYDMNSRSFAASNDNLWSVSLNENVLFSDVLNIGDKIFVGTIDDDYPHNCGVYSLDAKSGNVVWNFKTDNSIKNSLAYYDKTIIAQDCDGKVYCLDEANGKLIWKTEAKLNTPNYSTTGICVSDGVAYVGNCAYITALDAKSGTVIWVSDNHGGECSPSRMVINANKLIVGSHWNKLFALDTSTGEMLWEMKNDGLRYRSTTPTFTSDGKIFVTAGDSLFLIDGENGKMISKTTLKGYNFDTISTPIIDGDIAYVSTATKGVIAFNLSTLKEAWKFETKRDMIYTSPYTNQDAKTVEGSVIINGESLIFGASDGYIYEVHKQSGELIRETFIGIPILTSPLVYDNSIIFADFTGRITRLK